jgi:hypothetical protein
MTGQFHPYPECAAQVRKILDAGLRITHLDTHKHAHLLPPVAEAVGRVSQDFGIRWVRPPLEAPVAGWLSRRRLRKHGCRMADHLLGFAETGRLDEDRLLKLVRRIPPPASPNCCATRLLPVRAARIASHPAQGEPRTRAGGFDLAGGAAAARRIQRAPGQLLLRRSRPRNSLRAGLKHGPGRLHPPLLDTEAPRTHGIAEPCSNAWSTWHVPSHEPRTALRR